MDHLQKLWGKIKFYNFVESNYMILKKDIMRLYKGTFSKCPFITKKTKTDSKYFHFGSVSAVILLQNISRFYKRKNACLLFRGSFFSTFARF